ncbi:RHS repeat-associated core domain-containing protein [Polyangium jinanense]|uniref:Type IV secretion protein Rhs n=1 Tax=Polyangium jinanense TaxID=2829994 RepID=A0A9X3X210_9BACT|nr:RHS repeat-associated core domain-containing protein [Polyangium jinanense]MDC3982187.1 type IV secretion protein Rhs [Polyangium jinanense]
MRWVFVHLSWLLVLFVIAQGCTCGNGSIPPSAPGPIACRPQHPVLSIPSTAASEPEILAAGTIPSTFSVTSTGDAALVIPLETVPGRAGVEPEMALVYDSGGENGVLGMGFSLRGPSAITRCPRNFAIDGEIRGVRYDTRDALCLDGNRLIPVDEGAATVEYRTLPDTRVKVVGHFPKGGASESALFFEAFLPTGLVIEYGKGDGGKPLAQGGVPRAWLATKVKDGRGNAMTYGYCFAEADGYTAEYALDEVRYTSFEGAPASRAVVLTYGTKDPVDVRTHFSGGMALQSSLRLDEIRMIGGDTLVRRYGLRYTLSETTGRTLLTEVEECGGDGVCKPPTHFQYRSDAPGFERIETNIAAPTSRRASPMLFDMNGDGLDELVIPDTNAALSTPQNPITEWLVAKNGGAATSPQYFAEPTLAFSQEWDIVADPEGPSDPSLIQPELGTTIDYNQDGLADVLLHDVHGRLVHETVLLSRPDQTFDLHDTGITRPFPLGAAPPPPMLTSPGGSVHLADLDGDGVLDRIQCEDHSTDATDVPGVTVWTAQLWRPAEGSTPAGFEPEGKRIEPLAGAPCDMHLYTVDLDADRKVELVAPRVAKFGGTSEIPLSTYKALTRLRDGSFEVFDTKLPIQRAGGRVVFLDVNGDRLPDAVQSGWPDHLLRTYLNTGPTFQKTPEESLEWDGIGEQDSFFHLAVPLDHDGDGRTDLLMPIPAGVMPNVSSTLPAWFVLRATGARNAPTFTPIDAEIPFEALLGDAVTLADPRGPRVGDVNGDGAADVVLLLGGVFNIFQSRAADQDVLVGVSDGMNDHDPGEPAFVPSIGLSYGHLTDEWITNGATANDPALETYLYRSHADPTNDCGYPRRCAVGPRRVVSAYAVSDGQGGQRHFRVRYEDGRYHRLGLGGLGFAKRILTDVETGAGEAVFYDNMTYFETASGTVFPFAGRPKQQWRWYPALAGASDPSRVERFLVEMTPTFVPTNDGKTYFTLITERRARRVEEVENGGATLLTDTTEAVTSFDAFGNVLEFERKTAGVDLTLRVKRTFENDTERWVLGQLETQEECSAALNLSQCLKVTRTNTPYGEVRAESTETGDGSPETRLLVVLERDEFGNVTDVAADDAYGHHRSVHIELDPEGIFPESYTNAAGHTTRVEFDPGLGVLAKLTDPNGLVTKWTHDGFGRRTLEERPDGTTTRITLSREREGDAWRVTERTTTSGGADDTASLDRLARPVRVVTHAPDTPEQAGSSPRVTQVIEYDRLSGKVARRSVPTSEDTPDAELLFDEYEFDMLGREVLHRAPWGATTRTSYKGLAIETLDPHLQSTVVTNDPLGRPKTVKDAKNGTTTYTYGPFGALHTVTDPGGALMRMTRDALGRVRKREDPDRGTTIEVHDGFGDLLSITDALGRVSTFDYDELGRETSRTDQKGVEILETTFTWDTAPNGIGKLHKVESPDGEKAYEYDTRGRTRSVALTVQGESELLSATFGYDEFSRIDAVTYPAPNGAAPFIVRHEFDAHGHVVGVRDGLTGAEYWRLTHVDDAGRYRREVFGNGAVTDRSYFADKGRLRSITTQLGATEVQDLGYDYDALLNLTSRTDALQPQHKTERFRYDALSRLTCAYFSAAENPLAPCVESYDYAPNGNLTFKSDLGALTYGDAKHPHAVTAAGGGGYGYDAVGNQVTRPGGMTVSYTHFDLPRAITQGADTTTFGYDGDQKRIRKTTPTEETLYFGDLYERVTAMGSAATEHRYYVHSPERVVAVVTRGGAEPGTRYLHVDHLGSIDAITSAAGVEERRSYDPFGQRRNQVWGLPPPASFTSKTTKGFTGHEGDDELGLVNMKGRMFDPRLGRFLTTDPVIADVFDGQSHNRYSYVVNNPLSFVDPTGFAPATGVVQQPGYPDVPLPEDHIRPSAWFLAGQEVRRLLAHEIDPPGVGAGAPATDVDTTGSKGAASVGLPTVEIPHPSGPGTDDPFGVYPPDVMLDSSPIPLFEQLLAGGPGGGRTAFVVEEEGGIGRDLSLLLGPEREVILLRPQIGDPVLRDPREQAAGRLFFEGTLMLGAVLTPGPEDDIALLGSRALRRGPNVAGGVGGLDSLARFRGELGLAQGEGSLARLDVGGRSFYGINAHGQHVSLRVNAITRTHAEADAFQQAANAGASGGRGTLYVDRALCPACGPNGGVRGLARQLGLEELEVITPQGTQVIRP